MSVIYLKDRHRPQDQEQFECFGIPAHVLELDPEAPTQERLPGADRRGWVYREMEMLGAESQSSASADNA